MIKIITYLIAELNSGFSAKHGNVGITLTENKDTLLKKGKMETHTDGARWR